MLNSISQVKKALSLHSNVIFVWRRPRMPSFQCVVTSSGNYSSFFVFNYFVFCLLLVFLRRSVVFKSERERVEGHYFLYLVLIIYLIDSESKFDLHLRIFYLVLCLELRLENKWSTFVSFISLIYQIFSSFPVGRVYISGWKQNQTIKFAQFVKQQFRLKKSYRFTVEDHLAKIQGKTYTYVFDVWLQFASFTWWVSWMSKRNLNSVSSL